MLDAGTKSVLAAYTNFHAEGGLSVTSAEKKALCEPGYTDHLRKTAEARRAALSARVIYEGLKREVDLLRTFEASRRCVCPAFALWRNRWGWDSLSRLLRRAETQLL